MTRRIPALLACLLLVGCGAAEPVPEPTTSAVTTSDAVPEGGVLLSTLGYRHAPADLAVPATSVISERVDQPNTVVAVLTAPSGLELAAWFRDTLPGQGWEITADANNSLLFERGDLHGAFTVTGQFAGLSIRSDDRS